MKKLVVSTLASIAILTMTANAQEMKFPQQKNYDGCIKPDISQNTMNIQVKNIYDDYKDRFRRSVNTPAGGYIYLSPSTNGQGLTISEAHGWGMVITVMMAGHDKDAKKVFDGMVKVFDHYKTTSPGSNLMSWKIAYDGDTQRTSNATDGDLDIAYALLLAYKQWKDPAYKTKALQIIQDIKNYNINQSTKHVLLGNWASSSEDEYNYTRPSDWMGGHFRTFAEVDGNNSAFWNSVADEIYDIYNRFQQDETEATSGLISDFVYYNGSKANSAPTGFLSSHGEQNVDKYATNAARVPWRVASDYALSGSSKAKATLDKLNACIDNKIGTLSYSNVKEGYHLDGSKLSDNAGGTAYLAPFVAARIASNNKSSLTTGWNALVSAPVNDAYQAAIRLQSMLLISGNWWHYKDGNTVGDEDAFDTSGVILDDFGDTDPQSDLEKGFGAEKFTSTPWDGGYGWMLQDWLKGDVKTWNGNNWAFEEWTGDKLTSEGNMKEVFIGGYMKAKFQDSSAIYVNFPNKDKDGNKTDWYDLSDMTGFSIKGKGTGTVTVIFNTDNEGTLADPQNEFWGGYATTVTLDGTDKEINVIADLLAPVPFSKEAGNNWTWKDNGSKKVSGITLFAPSAIDVELDYIKINGANIKNETFGFTTKEVVGPVDGENVISHGTWDVYADDKGSEGTAKESNGVLDVTMKRVAFTKQDAYDTYASLSAYFTGDFTGLDTVQIKYTSDKPLKLQIPMKGVTDENGTAHFIVLPASSSEKTVTAPIGTFAQPTWTEAADSAKLDLSKVTGVNLEIDSDDQGELNASFSLKELLLIGADIEASPIADNSFSAAKTGLNNLITSAGLVKAQLVLPQNGQMNLAIVNMQGRIVARQNFTAQTGVNNISIDMSGRATGLYFMVVKGAGINFNQKFLLQ